MTQATDIEVGSTSTSSSTTALEPTRSIIIRPDPGIDVQEMARFIGIAFGKTADSYVQLCTFTYEGNDKPRVNHFVMGGELVSDKGETYEATPDVIAEMVAQADADGILGPYPGSSELEKVSGWYIRMTTMAALPATRHERGGARLARQVIGFWADGDYGEKGHRRKSGQLPNPPDADTVREVWNRAGYPEPSVTWYTGGGINGLWMFPEPITIPEGPEGEELYAKLSTASKRWGGHLARTARSMGYNHDTGGDLARVLRLPGSVNRKADHAYDPKAVYADYTGASYELDELTALLPQETVNERQKPVQSFNGQQADGDTSWDAYNAYMWAEGRFRRQLADDGWQPHSLQSGLVENLTHPNKPSSEGQSATFGHNDDPGQPKLFNWSSSAPGLVGVDKADGGCLEQYLDPYTYLAATQFAFDDKGTMLSLKGEGGALSLCAKYLRSKGFGSAGTAWAHAQAEQDPGAFKGTETAVIPRQRVDEPAWDGDADGTDDACEVPECERVPDGQGGFVERLTDKGRATQLKNMAALGVKPPLNEDGTEAQAEPQIVFRRASQIRVRKTNWLWDTTPEDGVPTSQGRIPKDMLTMAAGLPGTGKSQCAIWLAAQITNGTLPGCYYDQPKNVIYAATEDDWERTIAPRLIAAGADMDRIFHVAVRSVDMKVFQLNIPDHHETLGKFAKDNDVALVVFDPMLSHLGGKINANSEAEVRAALEPLVKTAAKYEFTVLGLSHFNKNSGDSDPLNRLMGSRGFSALLRALIVFAKDKDAEDEETTETRYVLSQAKNNLGRTDMPSYSYTIASAVVETEEGDAYVSKFVLGPETDTSVEAQMANAGRSAEDAELAKDCKMWLRDFLTDEGGEANWPDIKKAADREGHSKSALYRVKAALKVRSTTSGFGEAKVAVWKLPGA
ncbi:AAA family ATPase [Streptomyces sp. CA-106131]|uniref:AAA family ATPase n=1 Tax=Streptomyces sp. CA-106131 TaxID=3240045 RepID=UPI003D944FE6